MKTIKASFTFILSLCVSLAFTVEVRAQKVIKLHIATLPAKKKTNDVKDTVSADSSKTLKGLEFTQSGNETASDDAETGCTNLKQISDLEVTKNAEGGYTFSLIDKNENPLQQFDVNQYDRALVENKIKKAIFQLCSDTTGNEAKSLINTLTASDTYQMLLEASLKVPDIDVLAGVLRINKNVKTFKKYSHYLNNPDSLKDFKVFDVQLQFEDGFIHNIILRGKVNGKGDLIKFENGSPIPFSAKRNFQSLRWISIYSLPKNNGKLGIVLSDLLDFTPNLRPFTKDYFPENKVYKINVADSLTEVNLFREKTSKILEVQVYSDLKGVDEDNPNGLIQVEFSKKLNFWTRRYPADRMGKNNYGFFNYFSPEFTLNKIENKQKFSPVDYFGVNPLDSSKPNTFTTSIGLYQHQLFQVGSLLNVFLFDFPSLKSTLFLNTGLYFGRTLFRDTIRTRIGDTNEFEKLKDNNIITDGVNTMRIMHEAKWQFYPDERYSLSISQKLSNYKIFSDRFSVVNDKEKYIRDIKSNPDKTKVDNHSNWLLSTEIVGFYKPSPYNQLFVRYRFNWDRYNSKSNFQQLQVGLTTYLTSVKKDEKNKNGE